MYEFVDANKLCTAEGTGRAATFKPVGEEQVMSSWTLQSKGKLVRPLISTFIPHQEERWKIKDPRKIRHPSHTKDSEGKLRLHEG
jgi:hypothetical protein